MSVAGMEVSAAVGSKGEAMKSQDQRIEDAAAVLRMHYARPDKLPCICSARSVARAALEAADREPPKWPTDESEWPTDESVRAYARVVGNVLPQDEEREALRAAFLADPILKAAVALAGGYDSLTNVGQRLRALIEAVREAGL